MKNIKILVLTVIFGGMLSACGNTQHVPDQFLIQSSGQSSQAGNNGYMSADLQCSEDVNIASNTGTLSQDYRGCHSDRGPSSVKLFSSDRTSQSVCVFPASRGRAMVNNPNAPITSRYIYQCTNVTSAGAELNFANLNFDSVYVVKASDAALLSYCIAYGNISACASQSNLTVAFGSL